MTKVLLFLYDEKNLANLSITVFSSHFLLDEVLLPIIINIRLGFILISICYKLLSIIINF